MIDAPSNGAAPARYANGRFGPANRGRLVGSRNRASHKLVMSIIDDFESHKKELLSFLREYRSESYFSIIARLVPKMLENEAPEFEDYSDAEATEVVCLARQALAVQPNPHSALAELGAILAKDPAAYVATNG